MRKYPPISISDALWSTQRALLSEVTPDLRAVTVERRAGIRIRCIYDRPIDEDLRTSALEVEGEVSADYPDDDVQAMAETQMDVPILLTAAEIPAYHRREPEHLDVAAVAAHPGGHPELLRDRASWKPQVARQALGRLAVQKALLGEVTPELRAVTVDGTDGVGLRLIYDHPIDAEIEATIARIDAVTRASLHHDTSVNTHAEALPDGPMPITRSEWPAFHRAEEAGWTETSAD